MLVLNLPAFENEKHTIPTKEEPIRTLGLTSRLPCHIVIGHSPQDKVINRFIEDIYMTARTDTNFIFDYGWHLSRVSARDAIRKRR